MWGPPITGGAALAAAAHAVPLPSFLLLAVLTGLAVIAESISLPLPSGGYQSFGPAVTLPALAILGPIWAAVVAAVGVAVGDGLLHRRRVAVIGVHGGQRMLAIVLAGVTWNILLQARPSFGPPRLDLQGGLVLPAVLGSLLVYALAISVQEAAFLAVFRQEPFWSVLAAGSMWRVPTAAVLGASGLTVALLFTAAPPQAVGKTEHLLIPLLIGGLVALLYTSRRQQARECAAVSGAVVDLLGTPDLRELLDRLADKVDRLANPDMLWITLRGPDGAYEVALARAAGIRTNPARPVPAELEREAVGWVLSHRQPLRIADRQRVAPGPEAAAPPEDMRAVLIVPLPAKTEPVGVLMLTKPIPGYFTEYQERVVAALAEQAAPVVNTARLYQASQRTAHQLGLLNRIFTRVATSLRPHELFETLAEELHSTLGYPFVAIVFTEAGEPRLMANRGYGELPDTVAAHGVVGRVIRTGRGTLINDVARDPDYIEQDPGVAQEACVPIINHGQVVGAINVEVVDPTLTTGDLDLLTTIAGYAAVAIEKAHLYEQTQHLATTDGMTGLLNYRTFREALGRELERAKRYQLPLSVVMIEIDKFKHYNDVFGHLRGDDAIRLVARTLLQEHRRQVDMAARYGGDEFMLLLPHMVKSEGAEVAERIRRAVAMTPFITGSKVASVTLSIGVASYPEDGETTDALVDAADRTMYAAKETGGNSVAMANFS